MQELQELSIEEISQVSGGYWILNMLRDAAALEGLKAAGGAVVGYNQSGAAAEFQMSAGAGTFG